MDAITTVANVFRLHREAAEERNSRTAGPDSREIGELAVLVIDITDALREDCGNETANLFCREAHPKNAAYMRRKKKEFNVGLGLDN
jgi:hypothetical protein